jgi:hypothetical protein
MITRFRMSLLVAVAAVSATVASAAPEHKNLQVLNKAITKDELKAMMDGFSEQLGVKCTFCHVPEQFDKDDRPHKADARRMIKMVNDLKAKKVDYFGPRAKDNVVTCGTCHRGKAEPEAFVP